MNIKPDKQGFMINLQIAKPPSYLVIVISTLLVGVLGFLDYISGYEMSFSLFYIIPISISIVLSGVNTGVFRSVLSSAFLCIAELLAGHVYKIVFIPVLNSLMRLGYFLLHSAILSMFIESYQRIKNDSLTDPLTGVINTRFFYELFERELVKFRRTGRPLTLAYIDIDNFKAVNDSSGHKTGDILLKKFSGLISGNIRPHDIFARLGGDEFILLLPETDYKNSEVLIARVTGSFDSVIKKEWPVSLSIGAVTYNMCDITVDEMINIADKLMYNVKMKGKNSVIHQLYDAS